MSKNGYIVGNKVEVKDGELVGLPPSLKNTHCFRCNAKLNESNFDGWEVFIMHEGKQASVAKCMFCHELHDRTSSKEPEEQTLRKLRNEPKWAMLETAESLNMGNKRELN